MNINKILFYLLLLTFNFFLLLLPIHPEPASPAGRSDSTKPEPPAKPKVTESPQVRLAIEKGLAWLANKQNANGSWTCRVGYKLNEDYYGREYDSVCVTALAGMAFMGQGNLPGRGKYGTVIEKALGFVLSCVRETDGYITKHGSRMYEHAFSTLFLSEVYGMSPRADVKRKLKKAVQLIIQSQNSKGGWRYQPAPIDADISVTVSTLQALRSARNIGIAVPKEVIDKAIEYVKKSAKHDGSFNYQLLPFTRSTSVLTACGVVALQNAGEYNTPEVQRGLRYILNRIFGELRPGKYHYFYGHYYASQAMYLGGPKYWNAYYPKVRNDILIRQHKDGYWNDAVGPTYATAMAIIILQIPNEYLPIFQR